MGTLRIETTAAEAGLRLDALVAQRAGVSRSRASELVATGAVTVDGVRFPKSHRLTEGAVIEVTVTPDAVVGPPPPLPPVVWEDDHMLVVDKPPGLVVHPAAGVREPTLVDAVSASGRELSRRGGDDRPGVVHRLDRDTSGLLVLAKTDEAHEGLSLAIRQRRVDRRYLALVHGVLDVERGKIDAPIGRHPKHRGRMAVVPDGRASVTWFDVRERFDGATLLEVRLETGRTHQIRTHLESIRHPIVGDTAYGRDRALASRLGLHRPFLHAVRLALYHPVSGEAVEVTSPLPDELERALEVLRG